MAYKIEYGIKGTAKYVSSARRHSGRISKCLLILGLIAVLIWSVGGDWAVTVGAFEEMAGQLQQGSDITEAFSAFCLEILQGAQLS